jgi:hypothetical protein
MDKLERYLDQVCRGVGGPRSLRQHLRQELREHLLDAAAEHRRAGLSEEQALAHALDDFGGPEQVRMELEAAHGHRMMAVVVDKAMQWKEMTMKATWLWTTCAHLALALTIAVEVFFISSAMILIVPSYEKIKQDGLLQSDRRETQAILSQADSLLTDLLRMAYHVVNYWYLWAVVVAVVAGLFEWRVRSKNKSLMRLSALGTAALVLAVGMGVMASALVVPFVVAIPSLFTQEPEMVVRNQIAAVNKSMDELDQTLAAKDWKASQERFDKLWSGASHLASMGSAAPALLSFGEQKKVDELRAQLHSAADSLAEAYNTIRTKDAARAEAALEKFREAYSHVPGPTK